MSSRRAFLAGTAGLAASALLGSALGRVARADTTAPKRLLVFFAPNGMTPALWTPPTTGAGWTPSPLLSAIEPVRDDTLVITGLTNDVFGLNHQASCTLRCLPREDASAQPSLDQVVAGAYEGRTSLRSLQLASDVGTPCHTGPCSWTGRVSWVSGAVPADLDRSPSAVFRRLYGAPVFGRDVLDFARGDLARYRARSGSDDLRRLDAFSEGLSSAQARLTASACNVPTTAPEEGDGLQFGDDAHIRTMLDLAVLALQCDATRTITYMLGEAKGNRPLDDLGIPMGFHDLSHTRQTDDLLTVGHWVLSHWTYLVKRLADTPDVDGGRLLDHTTVLFVSEFGDGFLHDPANQPVLLAGGGGGVARGQHLAFPGGQLADLWISVLASFGIDVPTFGRDGTGSLLDLGR